MCFDGFLTITFSMFVWVGGWGCLRGCVCVGVGLWGGVYVCVCGVCVGVGVVFGLRA